MKAIEMNDMPSIEIRNVQIEKLIPNSSNARMHSEGQIEAIAKSIQEFGFNTPILIDAKNVIIAGHARYAAARKLGLAIVPIVMLSHLNEKQKQAYIIADNQLSLQSIWDYELLNDAIQELKAADFNIEILGFSQAELKHIEMGWLAESGLIASAGENLDGIKGKITILCQQDQINIIKQIIHDAIDAAGLEDVQIR